MRRKIKWVVAFLAAGIGLAMTVGAMLPGRCVVLYHAKVNDHLDDFLVANNRSLIFARQGITPSKNTQGDTSEFGKYTFRTSTSATPVNVGNSTVVFRGSQTRLTFDPISPNMKYGFLWLNVPGVGISPMGTPIQFICRAYAAPLWLLGPPLLFPIAILLTRRLRRLKRQRGGLCQGCGYDLRASPDRCPECGRASHSSVAA